MPKVTVFILGQVHKDPGPRELILTEIARAQAAGIKPLVLAEAPCDLSLKQKVAIAQSNFNIGADLKDLDALVAQELKDHPNTRIQLIQHGVLPPEKENNFRTQCRVQALKNVGALRNMVSQAASGRYLKANQDVLDSYSEDQRTLKFYTALAESKVTYCGIDMTQEKYALTASHTELLAKMEASRASNMATIARAAIETELAKTGGLVFVNNLGMAHVHRFAYCFRELLNKQPIMDASSNSLESKSTAAKPIEVNIIPFHIFSTHKRFPGNVVGNYSVFPRVLAQLQKDDSPDMLAFYEKFPVVKATCFDAEEKEAEAEFRCPEFTNVLDCMIYAKPKPKPTSVTKHPANSPMLLFNIWKKPEASTEEQESAEDSIKNRGILVPLRPSPLPE